MINIKMNLENNFTASRGTQGSLVVNDDTFFSSIQAVIDGDFNGDGKVDLFVSQIIANGRQNSAVIVLLGDGSGGFSDGKEEIIFSYFDGFKLISNETPAIPETVENGVYRFFNTQTGTHFYSASEIERDSIINNLDNFNFESAAFKAATEANGPTSIGV